MPLRRNSSAWRAWSAGSMPTTFTPRCVFITVVAISSRGINCDDRSRSRTCGASSRTASGISSTEATDPTISSPGTGPRTRSIASA